MMDEKDGNLVAEKELEEIREKARVAKEELLASGKLKPNQSQKIRPQRLNGILNTPVQNSTVSRRNLLDVHGAVAAHKNFRNEYKDLFLILETLRSLCKQISLIVNSGKLPSQSDVSKWSIPDKYRDAVSQASEKLMADLASFDDILNTECQIYLANNNCITISKDDIPLLAEFEADEGASQSSTCSKKEEKNSEQDKIVPKNGDMSLKGNGSILLNLKPTIEQEIINETISKNELQDIPWTEYSAKPTFSIATQLERDSQPESMESKKQ